MDRKNHLAEQKKGRRQFAETMVDNQHRYRFQLAVMSVVTGMVTAVAAVMSALAGQTVLLIVTLMFSIISFINVAIVSYSVHNVTLGSWLFSLNVMIFSVYLLMFDAAYADAVWLCVVPAFSSLLFGRLRGSILSAAVFSAILFFFWTPWGQSLSVSSCPKESAVRMTVFYILLFAAGYWFESVRSTTATAMNQAREHFRELSIRDSLTGLYNRHWISSEMPVIMEQCCEETRLAVLLVDIDYFKRINDMHGHLYGDIVLKKVADLLTELVEPVGYACLWGGGEFSVLAEDCDEAATKELAEQLRAAVEQMALTDEAGQPQKVTVSIGAVSMMPTAGMLPDYLINCADNALYAAKNEGRNAVHYYTGSWYYRDFTDMDEDTPAL